MSLNENSNKKLIKLKEYVSQFLSKEEMEEFSDIIMNDSKEISDSDIKSFDPIAGSGGSTNYSRFYANNLENSVPTFSDGPYLSHEDDNYFRGLPHFTNSFEQG